MGQAPLARVLMVHTPPQGGDPTNCIPTTAAELRAPSSSTHPMPGAAPGLISPSKCVKQQHFPPTSFFPLFKNYDLISASAQDFFPPISEIPQGISRKIEIFARHPGTENWVVSSFHLVQPLLPALWDKSPSRNDKD